MRSKVLAFAFTTLVPAFALAAQPSKIHVTGEFTYGTNPDQGISLTICPNKSSRGLDPFLSKHKCFDARNIADISTKFEGGIKVKTLKNIDYDCYYKGTGTFQVSSFKTHKDDQTEMGGEIETVADANVLGADDLVVTSKDCSTP